MAVLTFRQSYFRYSDRSAARAAVCAAIIALPSYNETQRAVTVASATSADTLNRAAGAVFALFSHYSGCSILYTPQKSYMTLSGGAH